MKGVNPYLTFDGADQFWGARFGMVRDKYGVCWMFNCEIKKQA